MALKRAVWVADRAGMQLGSLTSETVQRSALTFQSIHYVHSSDGLALGMLGVGDGIADDVLQEDLQHTARLFVDQAGNTLDTASTSQTTDGWLGDALDVVAEHLAVTLCSSFTETLSFFTTS